MTGFATGSTRSRMTRSGPGSSIPNHDLTGPRFAPYFDVAFHVERSHLLETDLERRLAAILAADVVGYSRLMGQDEAGTLAILKSLRSELVDPKIAEHKGRIFKATGTEYSPNLLA